MIHKLIFYQPISVCSSFDQRVCNIRCLRRLNCETNWSYRCKRINVMILEHPRVRSKAYFNDIANTAIFYCIGNYKNISFKDLIIHVLKWLYESQVNQINLPRVLVHCMYWIRKPLFKSSLGIDYWKCCKNGRLWGALQWFCRIYLSWMLWKKESSIHM